MAKSHAIILPAQELSALQAAALNPQFASLFAKLSSFRVALENPLPDVLVSLAFGTRHAIRQAQVGAGADADPGIYSELLAASHEMSNALATLKLKTNQAGAFA